MSQYFQIHPESPQPRLIARALDVLHADGVIVYPTDSCYAIGCQIGATEAIQRISKIRRLEANHNFTLVCRDLSQLGTYAKVDNSVFRLLRAHTPGPYTFVLAATREVPRRLQNPKRKTVGLRVPDSPIVQALLAAHGDPILSATLQMPEDETPMMDPHEIRERLQGRVDLVIDGGNCGMTPTTVVDLTGGVPRIVREGLGEIGTLVD